MTLSEIPCENPACDNTGYKKYTDEAGNGIVLCETCYYKQVTGNDTASTQTNSDKDVAELSGERKYYITDD